ncbi:spore gernimation protein GerC [Paenibacillus sp. FSL R5-0345]|uniref:Ger(x)C family spore germination protein n=1 Tax=Paenibacillus sp. FSL R5-0345 TaxID=1536770 RepID=UPI0004F60981|nr:Ger(x)C family spore germination protein [Paenibacillus sp. FSL R5-0345]AIQ33408.1 spore gernimation protein GerC [Paenibacillus sp. FSL R5-0345]
MRRRSLLLCIVILLQIFITGCWSRRELNDLAITVGLGIDKIGDQYQVSAQVVLPSQIAGSKGGSPQSPVNLYKATGSTVYEAVRKITTLSPRKIYIAHLRILVLGEDLAKEGISPVLDLLSRDTEVRNDFFIVVSKNSKASDALKILTSLEKIPAMRLYSSLETSEKQWAPTSTVTLGTLTTELVTKGKNPVLTGVIIDGNVDVGETQQNVETVDSPTELKYSGLAVFKEDKLIGWLNQEESKVYNYLTNKVKSTVFYIKCPEGNKVSLDVFEAHSKIKSSMKNGKPEISIEQHIESNLGEVQCRNLDLTNPKTITELEQIANQKVELLFENTIKKVQQQYKSDIFGFGEVVHRSDPQAWKKLKDNWDQIFANLPVSVKTDIKIRLLGKITNSFLEEMK